MKRSIRSLMALLFLPALVGLSQFGPWVGPAQLKATTCGAVDEEVWQALDSSSEAWVMIALKGPEGAPGQYDISDIQANTAQRQAAVLGALDESEFTVQVQYETVPGLAGYLTTGGAQALDCHPDVERVDPVREYQADLAESVPLIHADQVQLQGIDGTGVEVAVLDTGIASQHPDLVDDLVGGVCFLLFPSWCPAFPQHPAEDDNGHGTHVSGIITSDGDNDVAAAGVAPKTKIFAYKVMNWAGLGYDISIVQALNDILTNRRGQTDFINMSLGGGLFSSQQACDEAGPVMKEAIGMLRDEGILTFAASANDASKGAIAFPACLEDVVSVGATYDADIGARDWSRCDDPSTAADQVTCFSNSWPFLDLVAPGSEILSTWPFGYGVAYASGTSMASPHAAAVAALLKQARPGLSPDDLVTRLKLSGKFVKDDFDPANIRTTPRIDARVALLADDGDDFDLDGCTNGQEFQDDLGSETTGGLRNPLNFWDFFDVPAGLPLVRDKVVSVGDIGEVVARFGSFGDPGGDPLSPPPPSPAYHTAYDRGGTDGPNNWNLLPADGAISAGDISAAVAQFGHSCG